MGEKTMTKEQWRAHIRIIWSNMVKTIQKAVDEGRVMDIKMKRGREEKKGKIIDPGILDVRIRIDTGKK